MNVVLVPGALALLPEYAGLTDPVADLRAACLRAVSTITGPVEVVGSDQGRRVAESLLLACGHSGAIAGKSTGSGPDQVHFPAIVENGTGPSYLVVANGSAKRTEKAPGHLDDRAHAFDAAIEAALRGPDPATLAGLDEDLATELWADVAGLRALGGLLGGLLAEAPAPTVEYADDPFGVQYWVMRWACES